MPAVYVAAAGFVIPATVNVAAPDAARVQLLLRVTVNTSVVVLVLATPQPAPPKADPRVTVGFESTPVKAVGHIAVIVLPEVAVNAVAGVKPSVHVDVASV